ncbi:MAG: hypothetical protein ACYTAN_10295, partial [Planctomycetota bacterium]
MSDFFSGGRISFPITRAFAFSLKSIRIRLGRMLIVLTGVASAIAFMTMLFSMATFAASPASEDVAGGPKTELSDTGPSAEVGDNPARVVE